MKGLMVDIDGVLANFVKGFSELGNTKFNLPLLEDHGATPTYSFVPWWCSEKQLANLWTTVRNLATFWRDLPSPVPEESWDRLHNAAQIMPLVYITSRPGNTAWRQTALWFADRGIEPLLKIASDKAAICRRLGLDVAIEDSPAQLESLKTAGIKTIKIDYPYNRHVEADHTVKDIGGALECVGL